MTVTVEETPVSNQDNGYDEVQLLTIMSIAYLLQLSLSIPLIYSLLKIWYIH